MKRNAKYVIIQIKNNMKQQNDLFPETYRNVRDSKGRFCTLEKATYEKAKEENVSLKINVERYKRAWLAVANENGRLRRELAKIKEQVKKLVSDNNIAYDFK